MGGIENYIVIGILVVIIGAAVAYLVRARKRGVKCIGCPSGCGCDTKQKKTNAASSGGCGCGCCGCGSHTDDEA